MCDKECEDVDGEPGVLNPFRFCRCVAESVRYDMFCAPDDFVPNPPAEDDEDAADVDPIVEDSELEND